MSYLLTIGVTLGTSKVGLSLAAQLVEYIEETDIYANLGSIITSGFAEMGGGSYAWTYDFPDNFRGGIKFFSQSDTNAVLAFTTLNPEDAETIKIIADQGNTGQITVNVGNKGEETIVTNRPVTDKLKISTGVRRV
jgi:hypothetical protein